VGGGVGSENEREKLNEHEKYSHIFHFLSTCRTGNAHWMELEALKDVFIGMAKCRNHFLFFHFIFAP
jgi:hypothetical protein